MLARETRIIVCQSVRVSVHSASWIDASFTSPIFHSPPLVGQPCQGFKSPPDPLALEITAIEDGIAMELNVATQDSRTLRTRPIFLARRSAQRSYRFF